MSDKCFISIEDGQHFLYMPDGTKIPGQVWTRVTDEAGKQSYVILKVLCRLKDSFDVALDQHR